MPTQAKTQDPFLKITTAKGARGVPQVVKHLPSKHKALSSNSQYNTLTHKNLKKSVFWACSVGSYKNLLPLTPERTLVRSDMVVPHLKPEPPQATPPGLAVPNACSAEPCPLHLNELTY
jgi:hypothetical protein